MSMIDPKQGPLSHPGRSGDRAGPSHCPPHLSANTAPEAGSAEKRPCASNRQL